MPDQTASPGPARSARRVVLTGASGRIGRTVAEHLAGRWDLTPTDRQATADVDELDVSDLDACRAAFAGADAVVHLAADPSPDATFDDLLSPNLVGPYAVARAAAEAGVRRLVLASSLHAVSGMPPQVQRRTGDRPRPANLYGASKAWSEAIGAMTGATTATSVVALRIGYFHLDRPAHDGDPLERTAWLSGRDAAELVRAAVEAELPATALGFVVANGVSANTHLAADLEETRATLGYAPVDDAWAVDA
ncbi:NAD-dependent epimerase/dehydratase family protein [Microlunatus flavus]|uniref:NAD dependent epimerase/dehydratase family protein n=1 Tax=Microlunatus flavus TaxID=1036181 RepID=A0A1H9D2I1_9ACTN|nr:NAD(P)-dependent oxidoreductase [Microlunatus flavus]SEQ07569.1 NAD dependent epimerase/dehydratase family protein [Microlunatus flavus]